MITAVVANNSYDARIAATELNLHPWLYVDLDDEKSLRGMTDIGAIVMLTDVEVSNDKAKGKMLDLCRAAGLDAEITGYRPGTNGHQYHSPSLETGYEERAESPEPTETSAGAVAGPRERIGDGTFLAAVAAVALSAGFVGSMILEWIG